MKAIVCRKISDVDDLVVEDVPDPEPVAGEVLIEVRAAGLNFFDGLMARGQYQTKPELPFTPGAEVAGVVRSVGPDVDGFSPGDAVAAFCRIGGYAEKVCSPTSQCYPLPGDADFVASAAFPITYGTSWHALNDRASLQAGESLLVLGAAGGVGLTAVELGKLLGARVIAAASTADKRALAESYGADAVIDYTEGDLRDKVKQANGGASVDVVYDPVGDELGLAALKCLGWGGRYLVVGFAGGEIPQIPANRLLLKSATALGVLWGASLRRDPEAHADYMRDLLARVSNNELHPHIDSTHPLEDAVPALQRVMTRQAHGKVILTT